MNRSQKVQDLALRCLTEGLGDDAIAAVIAGNQDLMPELGQELERVRRLNAAQVCAGSTVDSVHFDSDDGRDAGVTDTSEPALPSIPGYEVHKVLGRGAMGVVYLARHLQLKRLVAIKMVLSGAHAGPDHLARFRREAESIAQLQHPNI